LKLNIKVRAQSHSDSFMREKQLESMLCQGGASRSHLLEKRNPCVNKKLSAIST